MYKVPICRPSLPEFSRYTHELKKIWQSKYLSNFGVYANKFEKTAAKYLNVRHARITGNADIGLILGLSVLDLEPGCEVILPSFTFNSTANAIKWNRLTPIFADIDKGDWCLDPKDVERKITPKTRVVLATHVFGNPCQINELRDICTKYNLVLMFDSAHGYGSLYNGKKIGGFGDIEVFSFSGTKVATSAEGGLITTKKKEFFNKITAARNYGFIKDYNSIRNGANGKISELNALLGYLNLSKNEKNIVKRQTIIQKYKNNLKKIEEIKFQYVRKNNRSTYKDFGVLTEHRDNLALALEKNGVQTKKYFYPIHLMDWYQSNSKLKITEKIANECLCLPIFNEITDNEIDIVCTAIKNFFHK